MSNLKKLSDSMNKIEEQTSILELNVDNLGKISVIKNTIEKGIKDITELNGKFNQTSEKISGDLDSISNSVKGIKEDSITGFDNIVKANSSLTRGFQEYSDTKIDNSNNKIQGYVREEINAFNEKIKLDLSVRFDQHKKDTADFFKEIKEHITNLNKELKNNLNIVEKKVSFNKTLVVVNLTLVTIFSILILFLK